MNIFSCMSFMCAWLCWLPVIVLGLINLNAAAGSGWVQGSGIYNQILTLAVDRHGTLYAGQSGGVLKYSPSQGAWTVVNSGMAGLRITALAFDGSGNIYAGSDTSKVFRSTNGGATWSLVSDGLGGQNATPVTAIVVDPAGNVYAATYTVGVFKSSDGGGSWVSVYTASDDASLLAVASMAVDGKGNLYAGTADGLYESGDAGRSWSLVAMPGFPPSTITAMAIDGNGKVYAGMSLGGVAMSTDSKFWLRASLPQAVEFSGISTIAVGADGAVYVASIASSLFDPGTTISGLFKSSDGGASWTLISTDQTGAVFDAAVVDGKGTLYAASYLGLLQSGNGVDSWTPTASMPSTNTINAFALDGVGTVYAATNPGEIYTNSNKGNEWTAIPWGMPHINALTVDRKGKLYVGTDYGAFSCARNDATCPGLVNSQSPPYGMKVKALALASNNYIYAGTHGNGVYKSSDGGLSWVAASAGLVNQSVDALAWDGAGTIYAGTDGGLFKSQNGGLSWVEADAGMSIQAVNALVVDHAGVVYAGTAAGGVFKSFDAGDSWVAVNTGLTNLSINALMVDASNNVYVGTQGAGVFASSNGGGVWVPLNTGLTDLTVDALIIDNGGNLYAGTAGGGIFQFVGEASSWTASLQSSGNLSSQTLTATLAPATADVGQSGCVFYGAVLPNNGGTYLFGQSGWVPYNVNSPSAYSVGSLAVSQATLVQNLSLAALVGTNVYAGYGHGASTGACLSDMFQHGTLEEVYTIH